MIERLARAKINLALHVTGQREDGFHLLDSLVVFTELGDIIKILPAEMDGPDLSLAVEGPFATGLDPGENNLVMRAATALRQILLEKNQPLQPVLIRLVKNLPVASGIGGAGK